MMEIQCTKVQAVVHFSSTLAPSDHVFSVVGLTISKDRARLASDIANELVFLRDDLPGVQKYYEAQTFNICCSRDFFACHRQILIFLNRNSCTWINNK